MRRDLEARVRGAQPVRQVAGDARSGSQQEEPETPPRTHRRDRLDQVHAGHRLPKVAPLPASRPHHASSVGEAERCPLEHSSEISVVLRAHHKLRVDRGDEVRAIAIDQLLDPLQGRGRLQTVDAHSQDPGDVRHDRYLKVVLQMGTKRPTVAVDINPATRAVVTGTETFTREVCRRLPTASPGVTWRFLASRPGIGLGLDVMVLPFRRAWSQVRLPLALGSDRPDLLFVPAHVIPFAWLGPSLTVVHDLAFEVYPEAYGAVD